MNKEASSLRRSLILLKASVFAIVLLFNAPVIIDFNVSIEFENIIKSLKVEKYSALLYDINGLRRDSKKLGYYNYLRYQKWK